MIKVNLLRKQKSTSSKSEATKIGTFANLKAPKLNGSVHPMVPRLAAVIAPVIAVYIFNTFNINNVNSEIQTLNQELVSFETQVGNLKPELDMIEQFNAQKNKLTAEIDELKKIAKARYQLPKSLDSLQNLIPERAWLVSLSYKDSTITLEGKAPDDTIITSFMEILEQSPQFSNVTLIDSREVIENQGAIKIFNLRASLEVF